MSPLFPTPSLITKWLVIHKVWWLTEMDSVWSAILPYYKYYLTQPNLSHVTEWPYSAHLITFFFFYLRQSYIIKLNLQLQFYLLVLTSIKTKKMWENLNSFFPPLRILNKMHQILNLFHLPKRILQNEIKYLDLIQNSFIFIIEHDIMQKGEVLFSPL